MKKLIVILLSLTVVFTCVSALLIPVAAVDNTYLDLRPVTNGDAQYSATGATVQINANGTATITLTETTATVLMTYKNSGAVYQEAFVDISKANYVKYYYNLSSAAMTLDIHAYYDRGNKNDADLYLSGMAGAPTYFKLNGTYYGVWDMYTYLSERPGYLPADNIIKFSNISYNIGGAVGDVFTLYYFELGDEYDDDFGTVVPGEGTVDLSEEESAPAEEPSEAFDFMSTAINVKIDEAVAGESVRVFTNTEALATSNTKWSVNVLLKKIETNLYEVVSVAAGNGNLYEGTLGENEILLAVHSSSSQLGDIGTYQNVPGKLAAAALVAGEKIEIVGIESGEITTLKVYTEPSGDTSDETSEAPSTTSEDKSEGGTPSTGDTGIIALAVVSVIALAGAVVIKRK